jgi:hypothetical protein
MNKRREDAKGSLFLDKQVDEIGVRSLVTRLIEISEKKYGYAPKPEDYEAPGTYVLRPRWALAWKQFLKDATRWRFQEGD